MDPSKIVGLVLGNVSIPKEDLTLASKVEIFLGACEIFQKGSEDMLSSKFTAWKERNSWSGGHAGDYLFFNADDKPTLDWLDEKTKVSVLALKRDNRLDGTLLCITSKGILFFFSFTSKWHNNEFTARTAESWQAQQANEETLATFFNASEGLFGDALSNLVLISQQAMLVRKHRLNSAEKTRNKLLNIATMVTGAQLYQNAYGWDFR